MDTLKAYEKLRELENYSPLFLELVLESASPLSLGALLCSSQAYLLLVSLLSRDGGLKWGTWFLRFVDVPKEVVFIVISDFISI